MARKTKRIVYQTPERLSPVQVAAALQISVPTLYRLFKRGVIKTVKDGRYTYVSRKELERYAAEAA